MTRMGLVQGRRLLRLTRALRCGPTATGLFIYAVAILSLAHQTPGWARPQAQDQRWAEEAYLSRQLQPVYYSLPENLEILRLENGLQVILMRNPAQPMVGIYTQVKVGSAWEDFRTSGMSHMLEHLLFNGTDQYTQEQLYELADLHGAYNNAHTTDFYTDFMTVLPAGSLQTGLEIQSQMLFHSTLPPDKFAKEQGIVLGELVSGRDAPDHFGEQTLREALFAGSSLALPTLGTRSTIANLQRDDVHAFYKNHYVPNNMSLTLAGNFSRQAALQLLQEYYGAVPPGTVARPDLVPTDMIDQTRTIVRRGGQMRLLALAFEAPAYGDDDFFPFLVLSRLLDAPGSGILVRALDALDPAQRPELSVWWEKAPGFARLVVQFELPAEADPALYYAFVQDAAVAAREQGITSEDVREVVQMERTETLLQREQLRMTGIYTAEPIVMGGADFFASFLERLSAVVAQDVDDVLGRFLVDSSCLAVLIEPQPSAADGEQPTSGGPTAPGDNLPGGMQMPPGMKMPPAMAEALRKRAAGETEDRPVPESSVAEEPAAAAPAVLPIERSVLANGTVLVSQQNPTSPLMGIHLAARGRALLDGDHPGALNLAHRMLLRGVGGCDQSCLARKLRRLGAVIKVADDPGFPMDDYYTSGRFSFVRVEVTAESGPEVLELLADLCSRASFTEADFRRESAQQSELLRQRQMSARYQADRLLAESLYGEHPLARQPEGSVSSLEALDYGTVRAVYERAFAPENLILSIVSPLPHGQLARQWESLLRAGRAGSPATLPALPETSVPERLTASQGGEMAALRLGALLRIRETDCRPLELLIAVLSDRLAMDLRETRGLSYSAGAQVKIHGTEGELIAWLNPPRERITEGEHALRDFVRDFDADTITDEELAKTRSARRGRFMMRRLSSLSQAYYLAMAELDGDVATYNQLFADYDAVTLEDLRRVARKYMKNLPLVTVVVD